MSFAGKLQDVNACGPFIEADFQLVLRAVRSVEQFAGQVANADADFLIGALIGPLDGKLIRCGIGEESEFFGCLSVDTGCLSCCTTMVLLLIEQEAVGVEEIGIRPGRPAKDAERFDDVLVFRLWDEVADQDRGIEAVDAFPGGIGSYGAITEAIEV